MTEDIDHAEVVAGATHLPKPTSALALCEVAFLPAISLLLVIEEVCLH